MRRPTRCWLLLVALPVMNATSLSGQARVELTPLLGAYVPTTSLLPVGTLPSAGFDAMAPGTSITQRAGTAVGARIAFWVTSRFALEASYAYSGSGAEGSVPFIGTCGACDLGSVAGPGPGSVWMASARLRVVVWGKRSSTMVYVAGGPVYVSHDDDPWSAFSAAGTIPVVSGTSSGTVGAVVGLGVGFHYPDFPLSLCAEIDDDHYSAQFSGQGPLNIPSWSSTRVQNDLLYSLGVSVPLQWPPLSAEQAKKATHAGMLRECAGSACAPR
jgi:hypothetical protein